jgi:hypothetical protein
MTCCLSGALSPQELAETLRRRFRSSPLEDHSEALKTFTARLIFSHGSLDQFWQCTTQGRPPRWGCARGHCLFEAGYLLVIARRQLRGFLRVLQRFLAFSAPLSGEK